MENRECRRCQRPRSIRLAFHTHMPSMANVPETAAAPENVRLKFKAFTQRLIMFVPIAIILGHNPYIYRFRDIITDFPGNHQAINRPALFSKGKFSLFSVPRGWCIFLLSKLLCSGPALKVSSAPSALYNEAQQGLLRSVGFTQPKGQTADILDSSWALHGFTPFIRDESIIYKPSMIILVREPFMAIHHRHFLDTLNTKIFPSCVLTLNWVCPRSCGSVFDGPCRVKVTILFFFFHKWNFF